MMAMDYSRYPTNWRDISRAIRERDGWRCQHCGVQDRTIILRSSVDAARYIVWDVDMELYHYPHGAFFSPSEVSAEYDVWAKHSRVILTVHHIGAPRDDGSPGDVHDKMDCRDCNLISLCQRCHFIADLPNHIVSARIARATNRRARQVAAGQLELFKGGE